MFGLLLLLTLCTIISGEKRHPKLSLSLQFSSNYPLDEIRLRDPPLNQYSRNDLEGLHYIAMDQMPPTYSMDVSNEKDHTSLSLAPSRESQSVRFNIQDRIYELTYKMICNPGYYGENCDRLCLNVPGRSYTCTSEGFKVCKNGWTGMDCDQKKDACSSNPCQNGGKCQSNGLHHLTCSCPKGFKGIFCESSSPSFFLEISLVIFCFLLLFVVLLSLFVYRSRMASPKEMKKAQLKVYNLERIPEDRMSIDYIIV